MAETIQMGPQAVALTPLERLALQGIMARDRELGRALAELRDDDAAARGLIEGAHGLATGALGTTHRLDLEAWRIVAVPNAPAPPAPPADDGAAAAPEPER